MAVVEITLLVLVIFFVFYRIGTKNYRRWKKMGIKFIDPYPFFGTNANFLTKKFSPADNIKSLYNFFPNDRAYGLFAFLKPVILIKDPELIRRITIKDFDYFSDRDSVINEKSDPLFAKNLLALKAQRWRHMRGFLSPAFTGSKMKNMFQFFDKCGQQVVDYVEKEIKEKLESGDAVLELEFKNFMGVYTGDVIASTAFGIQIDSLKDKDNEFIKMAKEATSFQSIWSQLKVTFMIFSPKISQLLRLRFFSEKTSNFFRSLVQIRIKQEEEKVQRPDLIHLLLQTRKNNLKEENGAVPDITKELTDEDITSQALLFFIAGFETSSITLSFAAYEIAVNPGVQRRLQEEIDRVIVEDGGTLTFDGVMNKMKYLDMVVNESLRLWPPGFVLDRVVTKQYVIPKTEDQPELILNPTDVIWIPVYGLHRDPKYFPDPDKFDPERFNDENKSSITPFTFLPFGSGPRNCIGMRFGTMQTKTCLVHLLRNFNLVPTSKTLIPMVLSKDNQAAINAEGGMWIGLERRTKD